MKFCGKCGSKIIEGNKFCTECGAQLENYSVDTPSAQPQQKTAPAKAAPPPVSKKAEPESSARIICPECGAENPIDRINCIRCANKLERQKLGYKCEKCGSLMSDKIHVCPVCKTGISHAAGSGSFASASFRSVNIQKELYIGKKWFLKFPYQRCDTEVEFLDNAVRLSQGTGFATVGYKTPIEIEYRRIYEVTAKSKFSLANILTAVCVAVLSICMEALLGLIPAAVIFFIGKTAVVNIKYSGGEYTVPTEFLSEAEDLRSKLNRAIHQAKE